MVEYTNCTFKKGYVTSINCKAGKIALRTYVPLKTRSHLASSWVGWIYQDCLQTDNEPYEGDHKPADEQTADTAQHFASSSNTAGPCFHSCKRKTCTAEERVSSIDKLVDSEPWNRRKKKADACNSFSSLLNTPKSYQDPAHILRAHCLKACLVQQSCTSLSIWDWN